MALILVVDDDEGDRIVLKTILERANHQVVMAEDGDEALRHCHVHKFDIVMTDLQMPRVHGLELISLLRDLEHRPPIIAISGTGEPQLDVAEAVGADLTLMKPIDPARVLDAVTKAVFGIR